MKYIVGAYATAPSLVNNNKLVEREFYANLIESIPEIRGLEIPFFGESIHQFGSNFLLDIINPNWENVLSCVPGTMSSLSNNPKFGLASDDEGGRLEAVAMYRRANQALHAINEYCGNKSIVAVQIVTAPSVPLVGVLSSKESLLKSMEILLDWDWQGAKIVIEHCDTSNNNFSFEKGFLTIKDEIEVLTRLRNSYNVGLTINWARSAIEGNSVDTPIKHIKLAVDNNILSGLMFSGVSSNDIQYGSWKDTHMPFSQYKNSRFYEKKSLLNYNSAAACIEQLSLKKIDYLGIKLLSMPIEKSSISRRVGVNKDAITILNSILCESYQI